MLVFLRSINPGIKKKFTFAELAGTKSAIDVAIKTFEYKSRFRSDIVDKMDLLNDEINFEHETEYMIKSYLQLCWNFLKAKVIPVSVFDGKAPELKTITQAARRGKYDHGMDKINRLRRIGKLLTNDLEMELGDDDLVFLRDGFPKPIATIGNLLDRLKTELKASIQVTPEDRAKLWNVLETLGLPCVQAPSEAEFLCSQLCLQRQVASVVSKDSDCLMYYCPILITKVTYLGGHIVPKPPQGELYLFDDILKITELTPSAFKDFCIMCGTDFNDNSPGVGPAGNFTLIKTFGSIKNIIKAKQYLVEYMKINGIEESGLSKNDKMLFKLDTSVYNYDAVIDFMSTPAVFDPKDLEMKIHKKHKEKITPLLIEKLPISLYKKCEIYLDRILDSMSEFFKPEQ